MKRFGHLLFLLLLTTSAVFSQQRKFQWQTLTSGGYTYKTVVGDPMKARFYTLKNGLSVVLSVNKKEPRIQSIIAVRAGSNNDPKDHTGLAHYLEHLMFKGTDKYGTKDWESEKQLLDQIDKLYENYNHSTDTEERAGIYRRIDSISGLAAKYAIANEYDKMMTAMGAQGTNASTWFDFTNYLDDIPSNAIDKYFTIQAERFRNPVFRLFHTELEAVYEEKNISLDNDGDKVDELMYSLLFPTSNYGKQTTIGTIEHLKNPSLIEIRNFYNRNYVPNNMAVVMSGDFDPDYVVKCIDQKLGYMQPKPVEVYKAPQEPAITAPVVREVFGPDAESVNIGFRLPGNAEPGAVMMITALRNLLANGKAGLIDLNLIKKQAVLSASVGVSSYKDYSVFELTAKSKADQSLEQVKDLLLQQINSIRNGEFDEKLIRATVDNIKLRQLQSLESNASRAYSLFGNFIDDRNASWATKTAMLDNMRRLTKAEIVDFVKKYFNENYVCIFKRKGVDKDVVKVTKPPITPVEVNKDASSDFLRKINSMPSTEVKPQWLDYNKDFRKDKIGNADLYYVQNKDNDIFRLSYRLDIGRANSKLLTVASQYLQFLGTDKMSAEEISKEFYNLACSFNMGVDQENTTLSLTGLQDNMPRAVELFENLLANCKADEAALTALKARIMKARANNKLNKSAILGALQNYAIYGPQNPYNNILSNDELKALKAEDLVQLLHSLTKYKHLVIYYGPLAQAPAKDAITKLHSIPASFIPNPEPRIFEKQSQDKSTVYFINYDMVQAEIALIRNTSKYQSAETPTVEFFNEYYGSGMSSVVFQTLRESKALAYATYSFYVTPVKKDDCYTLFGYIGCQADKLNEAVTGLTDLFNKIPNTEQLLLNCKKSIRNRYETERFTEDQVIYRYLADKRLGLESSNRKEVYEKINGMSFEGLQKFAADNFANKPFSYCIVGSEEKLPRADLEKFGEFKLLTKEEIFGY